MLFRSRIFHILRGARTDDRKVYDNDFRTKVERDVSNNIMCNSKRIWGRLADSLLHIDKSAIDTELTKFEVNNCLTYIPYNGQHLVPMMWLFNIKTDGTHKARLVGRGDLMKAYVDFDPDASYCGNVSSCSIKICMTIAAKYKLKYGEVI